MTSDLNGKSQHATVKNLGSDHILMPFYLKKVKLVFSFGYNYFNHTRRSLCNEHPNRQLKAKSSEYKEALQHVAIVTGHPPVLPTTSARAGTYRPPISYPAGH